MVAHALKDRRSEHDGRNLEVQRRVAALPGFQEIAQDVKKLLEQCSETTITMSFCCNHGKHRSVACAEIFGVVLRQFGIEVEVRHVCLQRHFRWCLCEECERPHSETWDSVVKLFSQQKSKITYRVFTQYVKETEKCLENLPKLGRGCLVLVRGEVLGKYAPAECFVLRA